MFVFSLPPVPSSNPSAAPTPEQIAATYEPKVRAACEEYLRSGRGEVSVPDGLPVSDYGAFWAALASHMDASWMLDYSGYRSDDMRIVVPVPR